MNSLRPEDIYCDTYTEKKTTAKPAGKSLEPTSRPVKPRKKEHRRCVEGKAKIRRNLFGPVDHENTENFLKKELDILSDLSNRKWNFDFTREKPLDGRWDWEPVGPNDPTVPSAYRGTMHTQQEQHHVFTKCETQRPKAEVSIPTVLGVSTDRVNLNVTSRDSPSLRKRPGSVVPNPSKKSRVLKTKETALQPNLKGFLTVKKRKVNPHSLVKNKYNEIRDNSSPSVLHIMQSISPSKSFVPKDNVAA